MAGRIRSQDVALVRERVSIVDVISDHVTLKSAGGGNLKGLCPFHDERTPSFNVTPARGFWHCFGCGAGGDAISFLTQLEHLSFAEAVEQLASKAGVTLQYETAEGRPTSTGAKPGQRQRLLAAHAEAARFYQEQLITAGAEHARRFLTSRGFDEQAARTYGCGYAPDAWDGLTKHLRAKGFTTEELTVGGLAKPARSGSLIDRFRNRLIWPINDITGDVIGFGARRLADDDNGPKYLNTPETPLYKKSQVLYGVNTAKREIAKQGQVVIVEGYTDVMACHLAGVTTAVATCGTAFGADHIAVLRRLLMDTDTFGGQIIFTFDGDEAGQKAALKAFADEQRFVAQTFIAVSPEGMDPCELRMASGDAAVRDLVASRERLVEFALRSMITKHDLESVEGRIAALRATAPLVAKIKDRSLRPGYIQWLAGRIGEDIDTVRRWTNAAAKGDAPPQHPAARETKSTGPGYTAEREALKLAIQMPQLAGPYFDEVGPEYYNGPLHAAVRTGIAEAGGAAAATAGANWIALVTGACGDLAASALVAELAVEPIILAGEPDAFYVNTTLATVQRPTVERQVTGVKSRLQRINPQTDQDEYMRLFSELVTLEQRLRGLKEQASRGV
ncbi:MAG TPA: DNA primase [Candidatus Stackebrandtia excrementipullorum]|nr:DNA primase [Candidatus Stackebrandtia excrementipullorum]